MKTIQTDIFSYIIHQEGYISVSVKNEKLVDYEAIKNLEHVLSTQEVTSPLIIDISKITAIDVSSLDYACSDESAFKTRMICIVADKENISSKYMKLIQTQVKHSSLHCFYDYNSALSFIEDNQEDIIIS